MQVDALVPLLGVADVERSMAFYRRLGFDAQSTRESAGTTEWAMLRNGAQRLMLRRREPAGEPGPGGAVICLHVASAHRAHADLGEAGLQPTAVRRQAYGLDMFCLADPDGYEIAIVSEVVLLA